MDTITVLPSYPTYGLLLTAASPISHNDPAVTDKSNRNLFNRQKQIVHREHSGAMPTQAQVDAVCAAWPAPEDFAGLLTDLSFPEFVACCLTRLFVDIYGRRGGGNGEGLFAGTTRYAMLEPRLQQAAVRSQSLRGWWNRVSTDMLVGIPEMRYDDYLLPLLTLPRGLQAQVLEVMAKEHRSIVQIARQWAAARKLQIPEYAEKADLPMSGGDVVLSWARPDGAAGSQVIAEVPAVQPNSLRHSVVREPSLLHLYDRLGLRPAFPGGGPLPAGAEALFANGSNIANGSEVPDALGQVEGRIDQLLRHGGNRPEGTKEASNAYLLANTIREHYPSVDLLSGCADAFDLRESRLYVGAWLVCRENAGALAGTQAAELPEIRVSAYDLLDDVTMTRQGEGKAGGQMIFGGETLCAGARIYATLQLHPSTRDLTHGALVAAVETYLQAPKVGGQAARGFGWMSGEILSRPDAGDVRALYEEYLAEGRDRLRGWLVDGTLGCGVRVVS